MRAWLFAFVMLPTVAWAQDVAVFTPGQSIDRVTRACGADLACRSRADNRNYFDTTQTRGPVTAEDCARTASAARAGAACPRDMAQVCSVNWQINVCVDRNLRTDRAGVPMGNVTRAECQAHCAAQGRRLPTNNEWFAACEGTQPRSCLRPRIVHPIGYRLQRNEGWTYRGVDCRTNGNAWRDCMQDPALNARIRDTRMNAFIGVPHPAETRSCVSQYGVRNMVGVLGQWVQETPASGGGSARGMFNGGLYPQPLSSCMYTTVAHPPDYTDYSIGCRCAREVEGTTPPRRRVSRPPPQRPALTQPRRPAPRAQRNPPRPTAARQTPAASPAPTAASPAVN